MSDDGITTIPQFIETIEEDYASWETDQLPWFRGEPGTFEGEPTPLLPSVYRKKEDGSGHDENALLQFFRIKAPILNLPVLPERGEIDKWLFLARHVGLPTRLLDWTEGALIALYFALREEQPVVWMLNPLELNRRSVSPEKRDELKPNDPTITWLRMMPEAGTNIYEGNIRDAWQGKGAADASQLPVAVHPTQIHPLMSAQHSCFTVHGKREEGLNSLVDNDEKILKRYAIGMDKERALKELRRLGISYSTLFPDPTGLAIELEGLF